MFDINATLPQLVSPINHQFGINGGSFEVLGNNENLVIGTKEKVIRITSEKHRSFGELRTEAMLLNLLRINRCPVTQIIPALNGDIVSQVPIDNDLVYMMMFERLLGTNNSDIVTQKPDLIVEWGRTVGEIHRVISQNTVEGKDQRVTWDQEIIITNARELLPEIDIPILIKLNRILNFLDKTTKNQENFGLVHTDMRPRNFAYYEGKITHFDFDDICHHWFMYDVAVAVFHEIEGISTKEKRTERLKILLGNFLEGYMKEKETTQDMLKMIVTFIYLRCIYSYIDYYKRLKIKKVDSGREKMLARRKIILNFDEFIDTNDITHFLTI